MVWYFGAFMFRIVDVLHPVAFYLLIPVIGIGFLLLIQRNQQIVTLLGIQVYKFGIVLFGAGVIQLSYPGNKYLLVFRFITILDHHGHEMPNIGGFCARRTGCR